MPVPPALTAEQRREAYSRSLWTRRVRAEIKREVARSGRDAFVLYWSYTVVRGMKVYSLLRALPGVGEATANRLLDEASIGRHLSVAQCGPLQAERLFNLVDQLPRR